MASTVSMVPCEVATLLVWPEASTWNLNVTSPKPHPRGAIVTQLPTLLLMVALTTAFLMLMVTLDLATTIIRKIVIVAN